MAQRKFSNPKTAKAFSKKVNGNFNDTRDDDNCDANYTVTYKPYKSDRKSNRKAYTNNRKENLEFDNDIANRQINGDFSDFE